MVKNQNKNSGLKRIYLYSPEDTELDEVSKESGIPVASLRLALDENALSRIHLNHITAAFLDIPVSYGGTKHQRIKTYPLGIFFNEHYFVAVSHKAFVNIETMMSDPANSEVPNEGLLLLIMKHVAEIYVKQLKKIDNETEILEEQMKRRVKNTAIFQLMEYQRSLTSMMNSLRGLKHIISRITEKNLYTSQCDILEDASVSIAQAAEMADIFNDDLNALMDGFGSVISNSVNQVMKILTILTLLLSIPMVVAGMYGMNVRLPLAGDDNAFWYICGISGVIAAITGLWFYVKKML